MPVVIVPSHHHAGVLGKRLLQWIIVCTSGDLRLAFASHSVHVLGPVIEYRHRLSLDRRMALLIIAWWRKVLLLRLLLLVMLLRRWSKVHGWLRMLNLEAALGLDRINRRVGLSRNISRRGHWKPGWSRISRLTTTRGRTNVQRLNIIIRIWLLFRLRSGLRWRRHIRRRLWEGLLLLLLLFRIKSLPRLLPLEYVERRPHRRCRG